VISHIAQGKVSVQMGTTEEECELQYSDGEDAVEDVEEEDGWDDKPHRITMDGLYLGSMDAANNLEVLQQKGITHILMVGEGLEPSLVNYGFKYMHIKVDDVPEEDLVAHFPKAFEFIDQVCTGDNAICTQGGGVLVHCVAGVSRSATVCIGWLMCRRGYHLDEARKIVHAARPWILPNKGFMLQLQELQRLQCDLTKWRAWRHLWHGMHKGSKSS